MKTRKFLSVNNVDMSLLKEFSNSYLLESLCNHNSPNMNELFDFFKKLETPQNNSYSTYILDYNIAKELETRLDNNLISLDEIIPHVNAYGFELLGDLCLNSLQKEPHKLPVFLKKTAHFKDSSILERILLKLFKNEYYHKDSIQENGLKSLTKCSKVIESKGSNTAINTFYNYLADLDIRNLLNSKIVEDAKITSIHYDKNVLKLSKLLELTEKSQFKFDENKLINKDINVHTVEDLYRNIMSRFSQEYSAFSTDYKMGNFLRHSYAKVPESHPILNNYILKKIEDKKHLNISVLAHAIEYSPIVEDKLFPYIMEYKLLEDTNSHNLFTSIHILLRDCPRLVRKIPDKYTKDSEYLTKLILITPKIYEHLDYSNPVESFRFLYKPVLDNIINKTSHYNSYQMSSSFISSFPFKNILDQPEVKVEIKQFIEEILKSESLSRQLNQLDIETKELFIQNKIINYCQFFTMDKVNQFSVNALSKTTLSSFDFQKNYGDNALIESFRKFMQKANTNEIIEQFCNSHEKHNAVPFNVIMEILYHIPEEKLFEFFQKKQKEYNQLTRDATYMVEENCLEDLLNNQYTMKGIRNFYLNHCQSANSERLQPGTFLNQCYMIVQQEKMMESIPVNDTIKKNVPKF